jgi:hypothetical protein
VQSHIGLDLYINDCLSGHAVMEVELCNIPANLLEAQSNVVDHMQQLQIATELGAGFAEKLLRLEG